MSSALPSRPPARPLGALALALLAALCAGCADPLQAFVQGVPDYHVEATPLAGGGAWNHERVLRVTVAEPGVAVHLEASEEATGATVVADGVGGADLEIPDGTWDVAASVG